MIYYSLHTCSSKPASLPLFEMPEKKHLGRQGHPLCHTQTNIFALAWAEDPIAAPLFPSLFLPLRRLQVPGPRGEMQSWQEISPPSKSLSAIRAMFVMQTPPPPKHQNPSGKQEPWHTQSWESCWEPPGAVLCSHQEGASGTHEGVMLCSRKQDKNGERQQL